ncbi:MAG: response regulator [Nitrospirota bacterium]|nr:response regulator [Nitrospirota bacterium]
MAGETILLVDDEKNILESIERLFIDAGLRIIKSTSAEQALEFIEKENIAVLVSDNRMPGMKGSELLERVRVVSPDVVRVLMTGYADVPTVVDAINKGEVFRFIVKPWDDNNFMQIVMEGVEYYNVVRTLKMGDETTLLSLAQTIELKDPYTRGHCDRVAGYALAIADRLGLSEDMKKGIKHGSWLHDCGKIGVPESILNSQGTLNEEQFGIIKKHPVWGADVARKAHLSEVIVNIVLYHHERHDGRGYPSGISGNDIPIEARIVSVADCFDAVTTDRPYEKAKSMEEGMELVLSLKGTNFAPEIVEVFEDIDPGEVLAGLGEEHDGHYKD